MRGQLFMHISNFDDDNRPISAMEPAGDRMLTIHTPGVYMPEEIKISRQNPTGLEELLEEEGLYCPVCFPVTRDLGTFSAPDMVDPKESNTYIIWDVLLRNLIVSAEKNCHFCCFMITRFFSDPFYTFHWLAEPDNPVGCCSKDPEMFKSEKVAKAIARTREMCEKYGNPRFRLIAQPDDWDKKTQSYERVRFMVRDTNLPDAKAIETILGYRRQIVLEFSVLERDELHDVLGGRPVNVDPSAPEAVDRVKSWVKDCVENHADCTKPLDQPDYEPTAEDAALTMPTRLIKIAQESDDLILVNPSGSVRYTVLDFAGEVEAPISTSTSNLEARQNGFKSTDLPKVFQDAITVTKQIGIDYLWIQSICICTDSEEDRENEWPRAPSYLENAYLTIAAADTNLSKADLLKKHGQCEKHPDQDIGRDLLSMYFLSPAGDCEPVYFREESLYDLSNEPLSREAFSYQFRLLSPRILTYGSRMMWQCRRDLKAYGGIQDWTFDEQILEDRKNMLALHRATQGKPIQPDDSDAEADGIEITESLHDLWFSVTRELSRRKVKDPSQIFPALSAVAKRFSAALPDEYVAGMWRKDLLRGLLWSTWPRPSPKKPETWRAPSWSWASITAPHTYERLPAPGTKVVELARVVRATSSARDDAAPFGEIIDATVELRAPVVDAEPEQIRSFVAAQYAMPGPRDSPAWRKLMIRSASSAAHFDKTLAIPQGSRYLLLLLGEQQEEQDAATGEGSGNGSGTATATTDDPDRPPPRLSEAQAESLPDEEKMAMVHGLVIAPNKYGTAYERIISFNKLPVKGYKLLHQREETVLLL